MCTFEFVDMQTRFAYFELEVLTVESVTFAFWYFWSAWCCWLKALLVHPACSALSRPAVPNLCGTRDRFCGKELFLRKVGWF